MRQRHELKGKSRKLWGRLMALVVGVLLAEAAARVWFATKPNLHWQVNSSSAWRLAWIARQDQGGDGMYRPGIDQHDPLLGWRHAPSFESSEPILGSEFVSTNSRGARGAVEIPYERTDKPRVVVIGDSFAFGWGVRDDETYAAHLAQRFPEAEVVNLGVGGYGTDQMLLMLTEEGLRYEPDLFVIGIISADTERNVVAFRDFAKPRFERGEGELELCDTPVPSPDEILARERWKPRLADLADVARTVLEQRSGRSALRAAELTGALWAEMERRVRAAGAETLFVFAPIDDEMRSANPVPCEQLALAFSDATGARLLDLRPEFHERVQRGESFRSGHWGPAAHAVVGAAIASAIQSHGLLGS